MKDILVDFGSYAIRKTVADDENTEEIIRIIEEDENCNGRPITAKSYNESFPYYDEEEL